MRSNPKRAARYAIIPGDFATFVDEAGRAPRLVHYRVLLYLGSWTDRNGWFKRRQHMLQADMAEEAELSRTKFCGALADLVRWGFVEQVASARDKRISYYRVRMDRGRPEVEDDEGEDDPEMSPGGDITPEPDEPSDVSPGGDINREQLCHQIEGETSPGGDTTLYRGTKVPLDNPLTTTRDAEAGAREERQEEVRKRFGQMLAELWAEKPEAGYVIELFIGPLHRAKKRAGGVEDYRAFLADIRDGLAAKDFDIATLARALQLAADDRNVMPSRPQCLAYCERAKTEIALERQAFALKRKGEVMREANPEFAARTQALHERLRNRLGRAVFDEWFEGLQCRRLEGTTLVVSVPIKFLANWIRSHYEVELTECAIAEFPVAQRVLIEALDAPARRSA